MERSLRLNPLSISLIYAALAGSWIFFSDTLLHRLGVSEEAFYRFAVLKGIGFVIFTSFILYLLVQRMVSQLKAARLAHEAELRESEERFSTAFNCSPEPMSISSLKDGRYIEVNEALLSMTGYERTEMLGRNPEELGLWTNYRERIRLADKLSNGQPVQGVTAAIRCKDGREIELETSAQKIMLKGENYILLVGRDVTLQRRLERQFLEAQKMEALGQFAAGIAHDFKNLLMLVRGYSEMLELSGTKNSDYRQQVLSAVDKADLLTRQLLAYSRKQDVRPEVLDLNHSVTELSVMVRQMFPKSIQVTTVLQPGLWRVLGDRGQMEQVLMNLAVNSQHAMANGGAFVISTTNKSVEQGFFGMDGNMVPVGDYVEVGVRDTGCGIPADLLKRIFEPFFTTKERGKGTGLGLAAVYGIVKQSNGYTLVESQEGSGTTFRILLPRHAGGKDMPRA